MEVNVLRDVKPYEYGPVEIFATFRTNALYVILKAARSFQMWVQYTPVTDHVTYVPTDSKRSSGCAGRKKADWSKLVTV